MSHAKTNEPFWWFLFSGGGVVTAIVMPALIILTFVAAFHGWSSAEPGSPAYSADHYVLTYWHMKMLIGNPLVKLALFVCLTLSMFHCAHRIRHTLEEWGLGRWHTLVMGASIFTAILGMILLAIALLHI